MIFTEARFLVFFLVVFAVHWGLRSPRSRKLWLLAASYLFYGAWHAYFLGLILGSTVLDYTVARAMAKEKKPGRRKLYLSLSLLGNLGMLGLFKYYDFFSESAAELLSWLGLGVSPHTLGWILPVGISFYTFQTLSYTIDVYRGSLKPAKGFLDFALFVGFFPQLVAGPIVRASHFLPQLDKPRLFASIDIRACLTLFLVGYIKKGVVSDHLAPIIDPVFADPAAFTTLSNWGSVLLYHVQIYCDFSGYSDMAIGTAGLLGYHLPQNFNFPYVSRNMTEFWTRWHISLSTWFRDYLYISLGGSRGSGLKAMLIGSATMLLVGLWHGAGWKYLGFGVLMSGSIVAGRLWELWVPKDSVPRRVVSAMGTPMVWYFLFINWIVFRSVGWTEAMDMFGIFFFLQSGGAASIELAWLAVVPAFFVVHLAMYRGLFERLVDRTNDWTYATAYGALAAVVLTFQATDYQPFIYFQF